MQVVQIMNFAKIFLLTIYFFFGSLVFQVQGLKAQGGFLETETIRQKLFSRMDETLILYFPELIELTGFEGTPLKTS